MPDLVFPGGALSAARPGWSTCRASRAATTPCCRASPPRTPALTALAAGRAHDKLDAYETEVRTGDIARDLKRVRNMKPFWSRIWDDPRRHARGLDLWLNTIISGIGLGYTLKHGKTELRGAKAADFKPIAYPKPDGKLTFDRLTNVSFSATNHEEDQPVHLKLLDPPQRVRSLSICRARRSAIARRRL